MKVGDYVRTDTRGIWQVDSIIQRPRVKYTLRLKKHHDNCTGYIRFEEKRIIKSSPNIIDLIEVGDYVNGYKVTYVANVEPCPSGKFVDIDCDKDSSDSYFFENEIKTIVTKEQFSQMAYRIGE